MVSLAAASYTLMIRVRRSGCQTHSALRLAAFRAKCRTRPSDSQVRAQQLSRGPSRTARLPWFATPSLTCHLDQPSEGVGEAHLARECGSGRG